MPDGSHGDGGTLVDVPAQECWQLVTTTSVGRIAWSTADGPVVIPVNFVVDGSSIYVRTPIYSALAQNADAERVALEVDRLDEATRSGWSVLARGRAEVRYGDPFDGGGPELKPWPRGPRSATVVIAVDDITGRRLLPEQQP